MKRFFKLPEIKVPEIPALIEVNLSLSSSTVAVICSVFYYPIYSDNFPYSKCPKISYTKVPDIMTYANSADPDQTAPSGAV